MIETKKSNTRLSVLSYDDVRAVSPALEHYTKGPLLDGLWKRPEMSPRDRSIVTVAALIARIQTIEMPFHFALALDNGVKPSELSEIITHLAFYSGWANAMSAVAVAKDIFHQRGIGIDQLPPAKEKLMPLNEEADQIGEEGLKDKVNNHYLQIFGTSIALGVVAGASQITQGGGTITTSGSQAFTNGAAGSVSQSATTILDRFIQIPPTITIREGHRVKVYFTQDLLLPAYSNHTIPQTF